VVDHWTFWGVAALIAALVALALAWSMLRGRRTKNTDATHADIKVYRDQLAEVARDLERGVLDAAEAERTRIEISRRLLDADRKQQHADAALPAARAHPLLAIALAGATVIAGAAIYLQLGAPGQPDRPYAARLAEAEQYRLTRPAQAEVEAQIAAAGGMAPPPADPEHVALVEQLREGLATRPDDLQGHRLLARNEAMLGNLSAAHQAQARVLAILGPDTASADDLADYADLMIAAADGYVSPEAEAAIADALSRDPTHESARYHTGLMFAQTGRPDLAFQFWRPLVENGAPDSFATAAARANIEFAAALAGIRYDLPASRGMALPGPSSEDIAASADLSDAERDAMVRGMVGRLSERLASDGGTAPEWAQLLGALGVLGEQDQARAILAEAETRFAGRDGDLAIIRDAARDAGLLE